MRHPRMIAAVLVTAFTAAVPSSALACWDGFSATVGHARYARAKAVGQWNPSDALHATRWAARFDALLPEGVELTVHNRYVECTGHAACEKIAEVKKDDPASAFVAIADAFGVKPAARRAALARTQPVYTVQIFAGSRKSALALRDRVSFLWEGKQLDTGPDGDLFEAGGFPGNNPPVHAVADPTDPALVRVVVEEYPSIEAARAGERALRAQGFDAIVKPLPQGRPVDERASSAEG